MVGIRGSTAVVLDLGRIFRSYFRVTFHYEVTLYDL